MAIIKELQNLDHIKVIATRLIFPQDPNDPIDPAEDFILRDEDIPELNSLRSVFMKDCSELFFKFLAKSRLHEINVSLKRESVLQELLLSQPHIRRIQNITPFNQNIFRTVWELEHLVELDLNLEKTDFEVNCRMFTLNLDPNAILLAGL